MTDTITAKSAADKAKSTSQCNSIQIELLIGKAKIFEAALSTLKTEVHSHCTIIGELQDDVKVGKSGAEETKERLEAAEIAIETNEDSLDRQRQHDADNMAGMTLIESELNNVWAAVNKLQSKNI